MGKTGKIRIIETDLLEHPAFQAWSELRPMSGKPERIEILKGRISRQNEKFKRIVCRLVGVGDGGASVIAKRCRPSNAETEDTIYKMVLPYLPLPFLKYYGMVKETEGEYFWIFLEDAGEETYLETLDEHRWLSAKWLAKLHTTATRNANQGPLPRKGTSHYLKLLQSNRESILEKISMHRIQGEDLEPFDDILTNFDMLVGNWEQFEDLCQRLPQTLVHGDFVPKNLRILSTNGKMLFMPFDWGEAGWGSPVTDTMHVDYEAYWSYVRSSWSWLSLRDIQRSAIVGKIFRSLDAINWEFSGFGYNDEMLRKNIKNMRIYNSWLVEVFVTGIITG